MTTQSITKLYDRHEDAVKVVRDLEAASIPAKDISLVANNADNLYPDAVAHTNDAIAGAGVGASLGTVLGGGAGLLAGLGLMAIPGVGPVVAAGWLVSTLVGAVAGASAGAASGGVIGALTEAGVSHDHAHIYAEGMRRGGTLVTARVDADHSVLVEDIMEQHHPVDPDTRGVAYQRDGWKKFDAEAHTLSAEELAGQRAIHHSDRAA